MLDAKIKGMKKHGEQNVNHKPAITSKRKVLQRLRENAVISPTCHPVFLSTWMGMAKKLDEVQFSIPLG